MKVSLAHVTCGAEAFIARIARVSNPSNQDNPEYERLIRYLIKHEHWSPFEMCSMCLEIETERDIAAQILRHRSFSFQEFSTRYSTVDINSIEAPEMRLQAEKNRQSSAEITHEFDVSVRDVIAHSQVLYEKMIQSGVARETARRILPLCTPTRMYMHGTIRSWIHYIKLRTKLDTQLEHRAIAEMCKTVFTQELPVIASAAFDND